MIRPAVCVRCRRVFSARTAREIECPSCLEADEETPAAPAKLVEPVEPERDCPRCAERIKLKAKACRFCGHDLEVAEKLAEAERARLVYLASPEGLQAEYVKGLERSRSVAPPARSSRRSPSGVSPSSAVALSFVLMGLGQIMAGRPGRGLLWILGSGALVGSVILGALVFTGGHEADARVAGYLAALVFWLANIVDAYVVASDA